MAITIAFANQKGGVAKTTSVVTIGDILATLKKKKVLLVDMDPQGNTSITFLDDPGQLTKTIFHVLKGDAGIHETICKTDNKNLDILPATVGLANAERILASQPAGIYKLAESLDQVRDKYDYILIDCPPSLGFLTSNALTAANYVMIPVAPAFYAREGTYDLQDTIREVSNPRINKDLKILGAYITMYSRSNIANLVMEDIKSSFPDMVFETVIHRSVKVEEAPALKRSIITHDPKGKVAGQYIQLTEEMINRVKK